jgi:hypothetical protein
MPPTMTNRIHSLLKKTERMKQQAVKGLLRTLKQIDQERKRRTADLEEAAALVGKQLAELGHMGGGNKSKASGSKLRKAVTPASKKTAKSGKRLRRSADELKKYASGVVEYVKAHQGCSGAEIRKTFPKVGQDIKGFVQQYGTGQKLRTVGKRAGMRYHAG